MSAANAQTDSGLFRPSSFVLRIWDWLKQHLWHLHPRLYFQLNVQAAHAYRLLELNTKPNINRLEYRKLFSAGRRYHLLPNENGGFQLMTTHKIWWHPRARSRASTVLHGFFELADEQSSRLSLRSNIRLSYLLDVIPLPLFFSSIVIYVDYWSLWFRLILILSLFILSWLGHRFNAVLEAHEMRHFVERTLEEYMPPPPAQLVGQGAEIVLEEDFVKVWDKFVEEKRQE